MGKAFNLEPGAGATGTGGHFVSPATALGASWERTQQNHPAGAGAGVTRPTELVRFPVTLNTPLKAAGAEHFCWINPSEQFAAPSGERWVPSCERGAFLYLRAAGLTPVYFPLA